MMIAIRSISGALNGNVATVKAAIGDITDETNSTEAFAMYGLTWTVGSIIGYAVMFAGARVSTEAHRNALGGTLSHPCERFPEWFGDFQLLRTYPYLLRERDPLLLSAQAHWSSLHCVDDHHLHWHSLRMDLLQRISP